MAPLGRAALLLAFGLVLYALVAGSYAAWKRRIARSNAPCPEISGLP